MPELTEDPLLNGSLDGDNSDSDSTDGAVPSLPAPKPTDLGKRILFYSVQDKKQKYGVLRFVGSAEFSEGMWCGIELDRPVGKNNGSIHGIRYFVCEPNHGVFVPLAKVELDTSRRSRSRPNSAPSSRNSSLERKKQSAAVPAAMSSNSSPKMNPYNLQKDLVHRLNKPVIHKRKSGTSSVTSYRQPLKAFATKEVKRDDTNTKRSVLTPFRAGGMVKAQSTENLRGLREKEKNHSLLKVGMPAKKSSSERDLRSSSTGNISKSSKSSPSNKPLKKKGRVNSCSDLLDPSDTSNTSSNKSTSSSEFNSRKSADVSSLFSESSSSHLWPRTSTPGNRDDQTPDGCSSPDDMSDLQSCNSSGSGGQNSRGGEETTPNIREKAFIVTPETSVSGSVNELKPNPKGLATQTNQFMENERMSPSLEPCRVPSPEGVHSKQRYKNRPSGTATLTHPLTSTTVNSTEENHASNGAHFITPHEFVKNLVGLDGTLEGVSMTKIEELFSEQCRLWHSTQVLLENRVHQLEKQVHEQSAEINKYQRLLHEAEDSKSKNRSMRERSHQMDSLKVSPGGERLSRHTAV